MSATSLQVAREGVGAWNRRDADWMIAHSVADFEFIPAVAGGVEGDGAVVRGAEGFVRFFADIDETWESFRIEADEFREVGEQVVVIGRVHATGRGSGLELDQPIAMACWFRAGKFARARSFLDLDEALAAAGAAHPEAVE